ncbi:DNA repair protein RadC [Nodosilinea sp. LEGE 06152]|uniref:RadC family protein n=1 Tax=Nodosilinea sp. LEGE 06152 TaxID=2777966 RepID=UPI00324273D3
MPEPLAPDKEGRDQVEEWSQLSFFGEEESSSEGSTRYAATELSGPREHSLRIQDMYEEDRPRQRLAAYGPKALSNAELLSILLGSGHHSTGLSAVDLAHSILGELSQAGEDALRRLQHLSMEELLAMRGVGPAKAAIVIAAIELGKRAFIQPTQVRTRVDDPNVAASLLSHDLMWETEERFAVLMLNVRHHFLAKRVLTIGSQTETLAHPRDIFGEALRHRAVRIIVAHNHPSGALEPSPEDLALTKQLLQCGKILSVPVLDHLILGDGRFQSLRQTTTLWQDYPQENTGEDHSSIHERWGSLLDEGMSIPPGSTVNDD